MLEFRKGFLCARTTDAPHATSMWKAIELAWKKLIVGEFSIWLDHSMPIVRRVHERTNVLILGDVFSLNGRPVEAIVDDLIGDESLSALDHLSGRFAVLIISGDRCRVANDPFGSRSIFYRAGDVFAVGSHAVLLGRAYRIGRSSRIARYMQYPEFRKRTVKYLPGDTTVYEGLYALVPNNYLDSATNTTRRYWPRAGKSETTPEEFFTAVDQYFAAFVPFVASRYRAIFGITGGVDSRAVYCAFRRFAVSFRGVTWGAGYMQAAEEPVIREIISLLDIDHAFLDPRQYPSKKFGEAASINSGRFRGASALTEAMGVTFGALPDAVFVRGYGGEIMRGFYNLRARPMTDLEPGTLASAYGSSIRGVRPGREYKVACADIFAEYRERANYLGIEALGYDPNDLFYWEHRMGMWGSAMLNEMDPAVYSLVGFNSRHLYATTFGLPREFRLRKQLLKEIIARNDEELAEISYE